MHGVQNLMLRRKCWTATSSRLHCEISYVGRLGTLEGWPANPTCEPHARENEPVKYSRRDERFFAKLIAQLRKLTLQILTA
jgi:hypothetical protein